MRALSMNAIWSFSETISPAMFRIAPKIEPQAHAIRFLHQISLLIRFQQMSKNAVGLQLEQLLALLWES